MDRFVTEFAGVFLGALLGSFFGWLFLVRESSRQAVIAINHDSIQRLTDEAQDFLDRSAEADPGEYAFLRRRAGHIDKRHLSTLPEVTPGECAACGKLRDDLLVAMEELRATKTQDEFSDRYDRAIDDLNRNLNVLHREALAVTNVSWRSLFRSWS